MEEAILLPVLVPAGVSERATLVLLSRRASLALVLASVRSETRVETRNCSMSFTKISVSEKVKNSFPRQEVLQNKVIPSIGWIAKYAKNKYSKWPSSMYAPVWCSGKMLA